MKTFAFSLSPQRVALSTAATLGLATLACPLQALAQSASINAIQLSVEVAPITVSGTRLGATTSAIGVGLATGTLPTLNNTGATVAIGTPFTTSADVTFNYDVSARAGDAAPTAGTAGQLVQGATAFGRQTGRFSEVSAGTTMAITGANAATIDAGTGIGTTATATISSTVSSDANQAQIRRVATSTTGQSTFTAERQGARYQHGGSGLAAVSGGGTLGAAAVGTAPVVTVSTGGAAPSGAGVAFTRTEAVQTGQGSQALEGTGVVPIYGTVEQTRVVANGGTAGDITIGTAGVAGMNSLTVNTNALGVGNSASLSVIQSLTAF